MRVRFRARARADIQEIVDYLKKRSLQGSRNVARAIYAATDAIGKQPYGSQKTNDPSIRVKVVKDYPYKIFYKTSNETIEILHVRHAARRPWLPDQGAP